MKENKKKSLLILAAFLCTSSIFAQPYSIQKTWVGSTLEYLRIDSQKAYFEVFGRHPEENKYIIKKDTLRLYHEYTTSGDQFSKVHVKTYDFRIMQSSDRALQLIPVNANALELSDHKTLLSYIERSSARDTNFRFKEIRFKATTCFGTCPDMSVQITNKKELKFIGGAYAVKKGFFTASIPDSLYAQLLQILSLSDLKNLKTWAQIVYDAPEYTLEIVYDDQIKCLKTYFLPSVCHELINYLLTIAGNVPLEKQEDPFELQFQSECGKYPNPVYTGDNLKNE
ncbi:DUF6438 domain-containing protein [Niabella sp. 22666]|uniref:DUF6438 domain-containing protein n=1 Tax=Niabella sp. 22666 TaxID=3453954 RepID=UPI003F85D864